MLGYLGPAHSTRAGAATAPGRCGLSRQQQRALEGKGPAWGGEAQPVDGPPCRLAASRVLVLAPQPQVSSLCRKQGGALRPPNPGILSHFQWNLPAQGWAPGVCPCPRAEVHLGLCGHLTGQCWISRLNSNTVW